MSAKSEHVRGERRPCPTCPRLRLPRQYLCWWCWGQLSLEARLALQRRDNLAAARFAELRRQIYRCIPLGEIVITR